MDPNHNRAQEAKHCSGARVIVVPGLRSEGENYQRDACWGSSKAFEITGASEHGSMNRESENDIFDHTKLKYLSIYIMFSILGLSW